MPKIWSGHLNVLQEQYTANVKLEDNGGSFTYGDVDFGKKTCFATYWEECAAYGGHPPSGDNGVSLNHFAFRGPQASKSAGSEPTSQITELNTSFSGSAANKLYSGGCQQARCTQEAIKRTSDPGHTLGRPWHYVLPVLGLMPHICAPAALSRASFKSLHAIALGPLPPSAHTDGRPACAWSSSQLREMDADETLRYADAQFGPLQDALCSLSARAHRPRAYVFSCHGAARPPAYLSLHCSTNRQLQVKDSTPTNATATPSK
ncbi:hypothetical protein B0H10DRAFT_2281752 [Mycena sp. CBHHK59/15]|nr:hypothetical protein B0H10DRAFT_2281752 [Mycena sp. CBHHK59/15]